MLWAAGNVKVYYAATGGDEVMSGQTFTNAALPTNLWVEGTAPSAATGDIVLRLNPVGIECPQAAKGCDRVVMTAVKVDFTVEPDGYPGCPTRQEFRYATGKIWLIFFACNPLHCKGL